LVAHHLSGIGGNFGDLDLFAIVSQMEQKNDDLYDQVEDPRLKKEKEELSSLQALCSNFQSLQSKLKSDFKNLHLGPPPKQSKPLRSLLPQNLI